VVLEAPAVVVPKRRTSVGRIARIAFDLLPLVGVHLALIAIPFVHFSWLSVLLIFVVTRIRTRNPKLTLAIDPKWPKAATSAAAATSPCPDP
jgi:hypothetical protein